MEDFRLLTSFYTEESVLDKWTHVFNERNPFNSFWTMLATSDTGWGFSQWCEGLYAPDGDNSHLGNEACVRPGSELHTHIMARLAEGQEL